MIFKKNFWNTKNVIFLVLAVIFLLLLPKMINIIMLFFGAYVLSCALDPYVKKLLPKFNRNIASIIVISASILGILALFIPIIIVAVKEISTFTIALPEKIINASDFLINLELSDHKFAEMLNINSILGNSANFAKGLFDQSLNITVGIAQLVIILIAITMIVFYILVDKDYLKQKFLEFFPPDMKTKANNIIGIISNKVGGYVRAQIISMAAVGVMVAFVLIIFRVEYSTLLGLISGILDIIPILGPSIALVIILLVACPTSILKVTLIILGFLACQQISNYVIKPLLFGKLMKMHPLMIFLALFVANQFLGFWGVILSPAIAATACVLVDELYLIPINHKGNDA